MYFFITSFVFLSFSLTAQSKEGIFENCYSATTAAPDTIPEKFCLQSAKIDIENNDLLMSGNDINLPTHFHINSYNYDIDGNIMFSADAIILNKIEDGGCPGREFASLKISGISEVGHDNGINPSELNLSVEYSLTLDVCHSPSRAQIINYSLDK